MNAKIAATLAAPVLAVAGCGGGGAHPSGAPSEVPVISRTVAGPSSSGTKRAPTGATDPCSLLTVSDVQRVSGITPDGPPTREANFCKFMSMGTAQGVSVGLWSNNRSTCVAQDMPGAESINGLGDSAIYVPGAFETCVDANGLVLTIAVVGDTADPKGETTALAKIALSRL